MKIAYIFCKSFDLNESKINIGEGLYIAADSGLETAKKLNIEPSVIIGDFDSVDLTLAAEYNKFEHPPEKDDTDSMLCVKYALNLGYSDIVIVGGIGGRIDHTLVNLAALKYIANRGGMGVITDGFNKIHYLKNGSMRVHENYKYISIIPISHELSGLTLTGFLYDTNNASVQSDEVYTVSNEILGDFGDITIASGEAFICECDNQ